MLMRIGGRKTIGIVRGVTYIDGQHLRLKPKTLALETSLQQRQHTRCSQLCQIDGLGPQHLYEACWHSSSLDKLELIPTEYNS